MSEKYRYIKEALLNPLLIMQNILGTGFPNESYLYVNTMYFTYIRALTENLPYDKYEIVIDKILEKHGITEEHLAKIDKMNRKLDAFIAIIQMVHMDLLSAYVKMAELVVTGSDEEDRVLEYRKLIDGMYLDPENMVVEFVAKQVFYSENSLWNLSIWLHESMHTLLYNMLHHDDLDKFGRVYLYCGYNGEDAKPGYYHDIDFEGSHKYYIQRFNKENAVLGEPVMPKETRERKDKIHMDVKRTEKEEKIEEKKDKKRNKTELPKQVNEMDKEAGCSLKHPEKTMDTQYQFETKVNKYKYALAKYLFKLNQMKLKKHIDNNTIFGMEVQNIEINKKFKKMSPWFDNTELDPSDPKYLVRFISHLFAWTIRHLTDVAEVCYAFNKDGEYIEYESKMEYVKYTVKRTVGIADKLIHGDGIEDDLLYFEELMMYMESSPKTKKRVKKNVKNFHRAAANICLDAKPFPAIAMYPQDIQMDTMVKLAYMVTTHDKKMRADLPFHEKYKFRKRKETKIILEELGRAIHKAHKKHETPPMFRYFVYSDPEIESQFDDVNENQDLATGVVAMKYLGFLLNDDNVREKIERFI